MKLDRLLGILTILLRNDRVTAPQLAERFEVTRRTIGRDIDRLCQAGIPVVTQRGRGGGISIAEGYKLDKSILNADELSSIIAALKGINSISETSQIERTLDKFTTGGDAVVSLQEPVAIDLASHYKGSLAPKIELIKQAVLAQQPIEFDYYYEKGQSRRRIEPYLVVFRWTTWYVFGFCLKRQDWRMFKLNRLWGLRLGEGDFTVREIPPARRGSYEHWPDEERLVALFEPSVKYRLVELYGLNSFTETDDGRLRLEIGYTNRDFVINWLLSFGNKAKVVEPIDMAHEIRRLAEDIISNYE